MGGIDRRGLSEIIAWTSALAALTIILVADLIVEKKIDHTLAGSFGGLVLALVSRGTQSASERRAQDEQQERRRLPSPRPRREQSAPRIQLDVSDTKPDPDKE